MRRRPPRSTPFPYTTLFRSNGETVAVVSGAASFTGAATTTTATSAAGTYTITPNEGKLARTNYDFTPFVNGALSIKKEHLTVTADDKSRGYGDANPPFTAPT